MCRTQLAPFQAEPDKREISTINGNCSQTDKTAGVLRDNHFHGYHKELAKWTEVDELCKLSKDISDSRAIVSVRFLNFLEPWEVETMCTKNKGHEDKLLDKYQHVYLFDQAENDIRRIAQIEWKTRQRNIGAEVQHTCLTILVKSFVDEER